MHFFIDNDSGATITGWIVLDNPAEVPQLSVLIPNREPINFGANVFRADLKDLGLHASGLAGFLIDDQIVADITDVAALTLVERSSGLPIYSRNLEDTIQKKLLYVEIGVLPQLKLINNLTSNFSLCYPFADRYSIDTINTILANPAAQSIYVTGQINWMRFGSAAQLNGFTTVALLRDPFEELAERLLFLGYAARHQRGRGLYPTVSKFEGLLPVIAETDLHDPKSILASFRKIDPEQRRALRSPMTATFGCAPEEEVQRRSVSIALDNLAQFNVFGVRDRFADFSALVDDAIGAPILKSADIQSFPGTLEVAEKLRQVGLIADLLDEDIALYSFGREAFANGYDGKDELAKQPPVSQAMKTAG